MRYDPLGRLYETVGASGTTRFLYDGDALVGEYDGGGNLLRRYVHGTDLKADDPIAWYEGPGFDGSSERFLRPDWQGSIALVSDSAGATALAVNTYDEYGIPGSGNQGRFQYTGQAWQPDLGMYYFKARFQSPTIGRFMQTDPIGYAGGQNLYEYVGNDPIDGTDFTGNEEEKKYKLGPVSVTYKSSGITLSVKSGDLYAKASADEKGASLEGHVGDIGGKAAADDKSASLEGHAGDIGGRAVADTNGASLDGHAGKAAGSVSAGSGGATASGNFGGTGLKVHVGHNGYISITPPQPGPARTIQPDKDNRFMPKPNSTPSPITTTGRAVEIGRQLINLFSNFFPHH